MSVRDVLSVFVLDELKRTWKSLDWLIALSIICSSLVTYRFKVYLMFDGRVRHVKFFLFWLAHLVKVSIDVL